MELSEKQIEFNNAMQRYTSCTRYRYVNFAVSVANVTLQGLLIYRIWPFAIGVIGQLAAIAMAYLLTDFINGLVHMYMDNNDHYDSFTGPLIANFHLHHKVPQYKTNNLVLVYFNESGSKIWLVGYLIAVHLLISASALNPLALHVLVYTGILSSLAEVSHYLCHSSTSSVARLLAASGVLLSKRHHAGHHLHDNRNYAFLNGISDPVLNLIAARYCRGYKQSTDLHFGQYTALDGDSR